jgi:hypothetical protein
MAEIALLATFLNTGFARAGMRISQVSLFMLVFMVGAYYWMNIKTDPGRIKSCGDDI